MCISSLTQTGHLSLEPSPELALTYFTKASEEAGLPEAQYKLGFLYGSNFGSSIPGNQQNQEGVGKQGSVRFRVYLSALSFWVQGVDLILFVFARIGTATLYFRSFIKSRSSFDDNRI